LVDANQSHEIILSNRWFSDDPRAIEETARILDIKLDIPDETKAKKNDQTVKMCVDYIKELLQPKFQDLVCRYFLFLIEKHA
jgi:hypothetical protein